MALLALGPIICLFAIYSLHFLNEPGDGLNDDVWLLPAYFIVWLIFTGLFLDGLKRKISWSEKGLTVRRLLRKDIVTNWDDVVSLKYNSWAQWWKLELSNDRNVIFYDMMRGSRHFLKACKTNGIQINH